MPRGSPAGLAIRGAIVVCSGRSSMSADAVFAELVSKVLRCDLGRPFRSPLLVPLYPSSTSNYRECGSHRDVLRSPLVALDRVPCALYAGDGTASAHNRPERIG